MTNKRILIIGFPHCGTTILKSIIGHIDDVYETDHECLKLDIKSSKPFILQKYPIFNERFLGPKYKNYIKIFMIRNPLWVFSSLNKRCSYNITHPGHTIQDYIKTVHSFMHYRRNPIKNLYTIKYENIFKNDFNVLRTIFNDIKLKYTMDIFNNSKYTNYVKKGVHIPKHKPKNIDHHKYRTYQINQPIINNNTSEKLDLKNSQYNLLINNKFILMAYPKIKSILYVISKDSMI